MAQFEVENHVFSDTIYIVSKDNGCKTRKFTDREEANEYYDDLKKDEVQEKIASTNEKILAILEGQKSRSIDNTDDDYDNEMFEKEKMAQLKDFTENQLRKYESLIINGQRDNIPWDYFLHILDKRNPEWAL